MEKKKNVLPILNLVVSAATLFICIKEVSGISLDISIRNKRSNDDDDELEFDDQFETL